MADKQTMVKKPMRLPVMVMLLMIGTLSLGAVTGAFMYATGDAVIDEGFSMKMISHTEYRFSEPGQIISRLVNFQGNPVTVTNCTASILYPDKSFFVQDQLMSDSANISGDHYYAFTTPDGPEGVYEYQSTCNYGPGGIKSASVTNSFHLSGAFTQVLDNLTAIQGDLTNLEGNVSAIQGDITIIQGDLTSLAGNVSSMNASLSQDIVDLSVQLNANISTVLAEFPIIQSNFSTVFTELDNIDTALSAEFAIIQSNFTAVGVQLTNIENTLSSEFAQLQLNVTQILDAITNLDVNVSVLVDAHNLILGNLTDIDNSLSVITSNQVAMNITVDDTNTVVNAMSVVLDTVDTTTTNTYNYLTGTLANNVQQVLDDLGVMNATINVIDANVLEINVTTKAILANQEAEVVMTTFSG